jgi:dihydrofolate reductase
MSPAIEDRLRAMGTLTVQTFLTLDGVLQAPGGPDEDRENGFEFGGWQAPFFDETSGAGIFAAWQGADALLLGRRTYDIFSGYWPTAPDDNSFTPLINALPRYVVSGTLTEATWPGTTILEDADEVVAIKDRHENIIVSGSGDLIQSLLRARLVDRLDLWLYPVAFGTGKRLFGDGTVPTAFTRTGAQAHDGGAVHLEYAYAGEPTLGDMTAESV